jgi:arylsulfatase A-like enzyme
MWTNLSLLRNVAMGVLVAIIAAGIWWLLRDQPVPRDTPVIIYLVDTLRADRLGVYGYVSRPTSPVIDAMAADSVVFDEAYAPAPWTLSSVASLITSTYPCEHGVLTERHKLDPAQTTLTQRLVKVGYSAFGRYANLFVGPISGLDRGFEDFEQTTDDWANTGAHIEALLAKVAPGDPFYLYIHTVEPHDPFRIPTEDILKFGHVSIDERQVYGQANHDYLEAFHANWTAGEPLGTTDASQEIRQAAQVLEGMRETIDLLYDAAVLHADSNLGDLIDRLQRRGVWDKAIFIFLSDHGEEFDDHGGWFHEQSVYDELVRVPLVIHFPDGKFGGQRLRAPVSLVDIMPTIFDYLGRPELCEDCRGNSLMPRIQGAAVDTAQADVLSMRDDHRMYEPSWAEGRGNRNVVVRRDQWKAIWNADTDSMELYSLDTDPGEQLDLSTEEPELTARFQHQAESWLEACRADSFSPEDNELDETTKEQLRALGYL